MEGNCRLWSGAERRSWSVTTHGSHSGDASGIRGGDQALVDEHDVELDEERLTNRPVQNRRRSRVFLSLFFQRKRLGIAYYEHETRDLYFCTTVEDKDFDLLRRVVFQVHPTDIVIPSSDEALLSAVQEAVELLCPQALNWQSAMEKCEVHAVKNNEFAYTAAKERIMRLDLPHLPRDLSADERSIFVRSLFDMDDIIMIRAVGGLLADIENSEAASIAFGEEEVAISSVKAFSLAGYMAVSPDSYRSLRIFDTEMHPSASGIGVPKEGFSLFGLLNRTVSVPGRNLLRRWFLNPLQDRTVLIDRLEAVAFFLDVKNLDLVAGLVQRLRICKDISRAVSSFRARRAVLGDFEALERTLYAVVHIQAIFRRVVESLHPSATIFDRLLEKCRSEVFDVLAMIENTIDFGERAGPVRVLSGVDDELDRMKSSYVGMDEFLTRVAEEVMLSDMHAYDELKRVYVSYFPQIGYLVVVPRPRDGSLPSVPAEFRFQFSTSDCVFFKNEFMTRLDNELGDVHSEMMDYEAKIVRSVEQAIIDCGELLKELGDTIAELDCLLALSSCAQNYNYVKPVIVEDTELYIQEGRHPLLEWQVRQFIPNDTALCHGREGDCYIVSGPNASGKSVYLQQVALIVFLAHIGSYVPAKAAVIGITDRIMTRMSGIESISLRQSAFLRSLNEVGRMLHHATGRSLLLLDEFGRATNGNDGIALLASALNVLLSRGSNSPRTFVATHFAELHSLSLLSRVNSSVIWAHMDVVVKDEDEIVEPQLLFRVVPGHSCGSFGLSCAKIAGVPKEIIARAGEVAARIQEGRSIEYQRGIDSVRRWEESYGTLVDRFLSVDWSNKESKPREFVSEIFRVLDDAADASEE